MSTRGDKKSKDVKEDASLLPCCCPVAKTCAASNDADADADADADRLSSLFFLNLPEVVLYSVLAYVSSSTGDGTTPATAHVLCHLIAPLDRAHRRAVNGVGFHSLWLAVLEREYGGGDGDAAEAEAGAAAAAAANAFRRRSSKRLLDRRRLLSPIDLVREAHIRLLDASSSAHLAVAEMAHSRRNPLTLRDLRRVLTEHNGGPPPAAKAKKATSIGGKQNTAISLRVNHRSDIGGTLLVECCRARYVEERVVLACAKEVVGRWGALPDVAATAAIVASANKTNETREGDGKKKKQNKSRAWDKEMANLKPECGITPLCVASARAMPLVVRYLLEEAGASTFLEGTGRFRLMSNRNRTVCGTYTPLGFARAMKNAELKNGMDAELLRPLDECISLLEKAEDRSRPLKRRKG